MTFGKPQAHRTPGRSESTRTVYNIKIYLRIIWYVGNGWIQLTENKEQAWTSVNMVMEHRVPLQA
jgi:hypothetical protein